MKKIVIKLMESHNEKIYDISEESPFPEKNGYSLGKDVSINLSFSCLGATSNSSNGELKDKNSKIKNDDISQNFRNEQGESYNEDLEIYNDLFQGVFNFCREKENNLKNESEGTGCDLLIYHISDSKESGEKFNSRGIKTLNSTKTYEVGTKNSKKKKIKSEDSFSLDETLKQAKSNTLDNDSEEDKRRYFLGR